MVRHSSSSSLIVRPRHRRVAARPRVRRGAASVTSVFDDVGDLARAYRYTYNNPYLRWGNPGWLVRHGAGRVGRAIGSALRGGGRGPPTITGSVKHGGSGGVSGRVGVRRRSGGGKGFYGTYKLVGNFATPNKRKSSVFAREGCSLRVEAAGNVSQDKCVYIGQGTGASQQVRKVVCRAITRKLALMLGYKPTSMEDVVQTSVNPIIRLYLRLNAETDMTSTESTSTASANATWSDVAGLLEALLSSMISLSDHSIKLDEIVIERSTDSATFTPVDRKVLNCRGLKVELSVMSQLRIQNRTRAHTEPGLETAAAAQDANNVENNPIHGKVFEHGGSSFQMKNRFDTVNSFSLATNTSTGLIGTQDIDTSGLEQPQIDLLQRAPSRHTFVGVKHVNSVSLQPGEIKTSVLKYNKIVKFDKLLREMQRVFDSTSSQHMFMFNSRLYAFEKMMHTDDAEEPNINIGYELNSFYRARVFPRKCLFAQQIEVV